MFDEESSSASSSSDESEEETSTNLKDEGKKKNKINSLLTNFRVNLQNKNSAEKSQKKPDPKLISKVDDLFVIDVSNKEHRMAVKNPEEISSKLDNIYNETELSSRLDATSFKKDNISSYQERHPKVSKEQLEEVMKKSVINEEFLKKEAVPPYYESVRAQRKRRKEERDKTKGKDWFGLPATELTEERKRDLEIMQIRDALDPKQFYRSDDRKVLPKYFQVGTVIEDPSDFYSARIPKKQRKQTIVDELLADVEFKKNNKKKYTEIMAERPKKKKMRNFKK